LGVLMVGFREAEFSPSCRSVLTSLEPTPSVEWVTNVQKGINQIESGNHYDVIVLDCRKEGGEWGQACQMQQEGKNVVIIGIINIPETEGGQGMIAEDAVGCRIDETLAPSALKWVFQQAQERKQFLAEQERLRSQLGEAAYKMEMADVTSTVLHNVGNVLTSVTVAANIVESVVDQSSVILVNRMAELIKAHDQDLGTYLTEDPKGKRIPPSLEKLGTHLIEEQGTILKEMKGLVRNIRHMKQIIASHQAMAKSAGQAEQISLANVLSHAMELSFQPGDEKWITIRPNYQQVPTVLVDQHQLLQILVNLLRNAKQAMRQQVQDSHVLNLRVKYQDDGEASVVMTIQDSGIGIAPEHLSKLFTRGFTTKTDGNGIGLHSSILAIQNMGGSMHVQSEGVGRGATFTLTFPVQKEAVSS
ncbi:MAG: HAMP domain-containing sensor histidine kinase, partial [Nitrospirota bacterium]|nr:HAMP domain-containing sensor histidine kinase [Nitrospirota bacterium]MDX2420356.1 HAMP domain-containing sensor histidine kinase [Nitrospirota bacterium]